MQLFFFQKKSKAKAPHSVGLETALQRLKRKLLAPDMLLTILFCAVLAGELIAVYRVVFSRVLAPPTPTEPHKPVSAVRINFEQYEQVIKRLDSVKLFRPSPYIEFRGRSPGLGRSNPLADPE